MQKRFFLIILILIVILIIINIIPGLSEGLGNFVYKIFSPFERVFTKAGNAIIGFFQILFSIGDLNENNLALIQKNIELETENARLRDIEQENIELREALSVSKSNYQIKEAALVVGKDLQGIRDWILINKGSKNGISKDMAVISPQGALVGKIAEISGDFSKVMLITDKNSIVAALIEKNRTEGLVKSKKGGLFMDFIPNTENLEKGQKIITSGMDNICPKGILIGTIEDVDESDNQIFQKINITPAFNFLKLERVLIIK